MGWRPGNYTIAELLSDAGYATALYGKWHLGDIDGRLPNDQGFDEWWGIKNTWDEAAYTARALFKESGQSVPMIWEGKKGERSKPVMPLDLKVRPIVDGQYMAIFAQLLEKVKFATRREELGCLADSEAGFSALQHSHILRPSCSTALRSGALACGPGGNRPV